MFMDELIRIKDKAKDSPSARFQVHAAKSRTVQWKFGVEWKDFIDEYHRISDSFSKATVYKSNHTNLLLLNKQLHELLRARMNKEKAVNGISQKQAFNLIISLIYMLIVTNLLVF